MRMGWYDFFSRFYDHHLEGLYADARATATEALDLSAGMTVLDVPCGTGQSFDGIAPAIGDSGRLIGVDRSKGHATGDAIHTSTKSPETLG